MTTIALLFLAGILTILLPCILPLLPIVLGVSIAGRSPWRPLLTVLGMVVSFVGSTFLLTLVLGQFPAAADTIRLGTYAVLFLFGAGFLLEDRRWLVVAGVLSGLFLLPRGFIALAIASILGVIAVMVGSRIASVLQQIGLSTQQRAREKFGSDNPVTAFLIGLTLGLVWVPCAGPALSFALTLVREKPGSEALVALVAYALGTALPLLLVGYGGQRVAHSARSLTRYSGTIKKVAGALLIATSIGLALNLFQDFQVWLATHTRFGDIGTRIEERIFRNETASRERGALNSSSIFPLPSSISTMSPLPKIVRAPELVGLGTWHNSQPFTLASLKGKVVLVDFWTYSCINCIRTLPHIQEYYEKFKGTGKFVLLGVHSPEFTFEKVDANVAKAIKEHGLTYPVAQDNDFETWKAFANRYWPAKYLIDAEGYIRYTHFGEGEYEETAVAIESLLREAGVDMSKEMKAGSEKMEEVSQRTAVIGRSELTPETYIGARSWSAFGNAVGEPDGEEHAYIIPPSLDLHRYYLGGTWQLTSDKEAQVLRSNSGEIRMMFQGGEINLVLGLGAGITTANAEVWIDGKKVKDFTIDHHDLYNLFTGAYGEHELVLKLSGKGVEAYAFTFGG